MHVDSVQQNSVKNDLYPVEIRCNFQTIQAFSAGVLMISWHFELFIRRFSRYYANTYKNAEFASDFFFWFGVP